MMVGRPVVCGAGRQPEPDGGALNARPRGRAPPALCAGPGTTGMEDGDRGPGWGGFGLLQAHRDKG